MKYTRSVSVNWLVILVILHVHQANLPHKFAGCYVTGYGIVALCKVVHKTCLAGIESNNFIDHSLAKDHRQLHAECPRCFSR